MKGQGKFTWNPLRRADDIDNLKCITSAEGCHIYDEYGKRYLDCQSGLWNVSLGYGNKHIIDAIVNQLNKVTYVNPCEHTNDTVLRLSKKIIDITPEKFNSIFFTCTGSESVELAIKYVRKYQSLIGNYRKNKIAVLSASYHGSYYGSMSASQVENNFKDGYGPFLDGFISFPIPFCRCCKIDELKKECLDGFLIELEKNFEKYKEHLGAIILEPILGSGGVITLHKEYLQLLRELCDKYGVLLIFDEVATGFGRTGKMFAFEHYQVIPDIICLSKCMNSGYLPIGAVLISDKVKEPFIKSESLVFHLSTQNCNPVCCASAEAVIDQLQEENYIEAVEIKGKRLKEKLQERLIDHNLVFDIRGRGLMLSIDLVDSKATNELINKDKLDNIIRLLKNRGLIVGKFHIDNVTAGIDLFPHFIVNEKDMDEIADTISKVLNRFG
ncbi:aspartate aminotransferase family protein [Clostridium cellulovorans]|uniref:Aminotransferase class-III n=1 Tax=Clostridium cellulovorans (strain ATCC 35296 / DSM 3052 / OCM 3 / 743B) TaxID=573061 RepID=D9SWL1_CLOC7|nr:aspartate aminotransferase family protein [Clostridium cellulovorans]ADL53293.1 aminotransferase class-III [Clostridium cellulovorans 743B]